ncbi:DNA polymerase III subunit alpha [Nitrospina sp. 32_T5]|uniref:DNA polymerase III subunit alpha n=1 Tax=unclassified Nitrospina TaxID=2638683 RepID=UPI003F9B2EAE
MWVPLNCHSVYSFMQGTAWIEDLARTAARMGCPALALTDTNGTYGAVAFQKAAQAAGIRPIFGAEVTDPATGSHAVLLAKTLAGYGEVCRVVTDRQLDKNFSLAERLQHCGDAVVILSPDLGVIDAVARARGSGNLGIEWIRWRTGTRHDIDVWEFSRRHGIPLVASNRIFFLKPEDGHTHRLVTAIRENRLLDALPPESTASPEAWFKSPQAMKRLFRYCPQALDNTLRVAEQCDVTLPVGQLQHPPFPLPEGITHARRLRELAWQKARRRYRPLTRAVRDRLEYELGIIERMDFASYFLLVWDIVEEAHRRGILTVGRGSAANSLVCRVLGITEVDPIRHNLYFERFLNLERSDFPDIDIDFPWNRRDEMIQYVFDRYGSEHVALISSHIHMRGRSTLREVGKALGLAAVDIDKLTRNLPHSAHVDRLDAVRDAVPECRDLPLDEEPYRSVIEQAAKVEGVPRHLSIHCGGIVVSPGRITDLVPLQNTPKGFVVTQLDMYPVEDLGLLKIDLLSQKGLAVEIDTVRWVREWYGAAPDFDRIDPVTDDKTRTLIMRGDTIGCFYIESPSMRNLLQKLRVDSFEELTAASSIIRPGVASSGMMQAYIRRHNGREPVTYLHPKLEAVLAETCGIMIYQEDVIKVAHAIAGMGLGEAEGLRKCMSKKRDWERMETYRERFLSGAKRNGVADDTALEIWRQIESFAGYSFCKAHSASFALESYRAAYLKAHYPAAFMAAVLSNEGGFYDACAYTEEARRLGLDILPPHVNHSQYHFTAERVDAVRVGLMQVKGLSRDGIESILHAREVRRFDTLHDFMERVSLEEPEFDALIYCGALDGLGPSRPVMLCEMMKWCRNLPRKKNGSQKPLPLARGGRRWAVPALREYDAQACGLAELETLELMVKAHPMSLFGVTEKTWPRGFIPAKDLATTRRKFVTMIGLLVTYKSTRTTKGELMKFVSLEDPTGIFEVTLFPKVYRKYGHLLRDKGPFIVKGQVEEDSGNRTLTALWVSDGWQAE